MPIHTPVFCVLDNLMEDVLELFKPCNLNDSETLLKESFKKYKWHLKVPAAYRTPVHEATGFSPNFLPFERENRAPLDLYGRTPKLNLLKQHTRPMLTIGGTDCKYI